MNIETIAVHGGYTPEPSTRAVATPIYQTTSYAFDSAQHGADLFDLKVPGNIYTRITNPTSAMLEARVAQMEGGAGALALASGMAAITAAVLTLARSGDNIVSTAELYGGTVNLFAHTLPQMGIEARLIPGSDPSDLAAAIDGKTKLLFTETIANPSGKVADLEALAQVAHEKGVPLVVDNTVATPVLCRPFDFGADIVIHSLTKYMGGHGTSIGGAIVDSGAFDWQGQPQRFGFFSEPDLSYHGVKMAELFGRLAFIGRARVVCLRNMGAALSPLNAFLLMQGMETLPLRMERHCDNALAIARFLRGHPKVLWVNYPGLEDHPSYPLVGKYLGGRASGILAFGVKGGKEAAMRVLDGLKLFTRLVNIGDAKSLACHPASTTHRQLAGRELAAAGVTEDMIRLSVGIEHVEDLQDDLAQALENL